MSPSSFGLMKLCHHNSTKFEEMLLVSPSKCDQIYYYWDGRSDWNKTYSFTMYCLLSNFSFCQNSPKWSFFGKIQKSIIIDISPGFVYALIWSHLYIKLAWCPSCPNYGFKTRGIYNNAGLWWRHLLKRRNSNYCEPKYTHTNTLTNENHKDIATNVETNNDTVTRKRHTGARDAIQEYRSGRRVRKRQAAATQLTMLQYSPPPKPIQPPPKPNSVPTNAGKYGEGHSASVTTRRRLRHGNHQQRRQQTLCCWRVVRL